MTTTTGDELTTATLEILRELYLFRNARTGEPDVREIGRKNGWSQEELWDAINRLESLGWIRCWSSEGKYTVTGLGAIQTEQRGVAPFDLVSRAKEARWT